MAELEFKYEGILAEENLQLSDLPMAIRKSINVLKPNYAKYQKNPTDGNRNALIQMDVDVSNQILNWLEEEAEADEEEERLAAAAEEARVKAQQAAEEARIKAEQEAAAKLEQERLAAEEAEKAKADEEARLAAEAQAKADEEARLAAEAQAKADEEAAAKLKEEEEAKAEAERLAAEEAAKSKAYKFGTSEMAKAIKEKVEANNGHILISELKTLIGKEPSYPYQEVYDMKLHKPYMKSYYVIV